MYEFIDFEASPCMHFETGPMEIPLLKTLLDSISNFALLSSSNAVKTELVHRYWRKIKEILDLLKPVFDDVICKASLDEQLSNVLKELDFVINEAQEIIGSWNQMSSKILLVCQNCSFYHIQLLLLFYLPVVRNDSCDNFWIFIVPIT